MLNKIYFVDILIWEDTLSRNMRMITMKRKKQGQGSFSTISLAHPLSQCRTCHFRFGDLTWGPRVYFEQGIATSLVYMWAKCPSHAPSWPMRRAEEVLRLAISQKASQGRGHCHLFPYTIVLNLQVKAVCVFLRFLIVNDYVVVFFPAYLFLLFLFFLTVRKRSSPTNDKLSNKIICRTWLFINESQYYIIL